jgi:hypothetical protein
VERGDIAQDARSGNRGQVHEPVEGRFRGLVGPGRGIVLAKERIDRLAVVRQVYTYETRTTPPDGVKGDSLPAHSATQPAASATNPTVLTMDPDDVRFISHLILGPERW